MKLKAKQDAYGEELLGFYKGETTYEIIERDDGYIESGDTPKAYFAPLRDWSLLERKAIKLAHGRILDIGCGAGRVSLWAQEKGFRVLAIDNSPLAIKVSKIRGVKNARVLSISELSKLRPNSFDTIIMYGNNFGLFGSKAGLQRILKQMARITSPEAQIIASCCNPYRTKNPDHLSYHKRNLARGRMPGQLRIRVRYKSHIGPWFDYLFVSPKELRELLADSPWKLSRLLTDRGPGYAAVLRKTP